MNKLFKVRNFYLRYFHFKSDSFFMFLIKWRFFLKSSLDFFLNSVMTLGVIQNYDEISKSKYPQEKMNVMILTVFFMSFICFFILIYAKFIGIFFLFLDKYYEFFYIQNEDRLFNEKKVEMREEKGDFLTKEIVIMFIK